jgi:parvulin-like peptidyl-prolyl isomerase
MVAPIGEIYEEAVESEFGFHVIMVTDRQDPAAEDFPTDEELADSVRDLAVLEELEDWFLGAMEGADVTVEEEYGTWQPNPPTVVAPVG